VSSAATPRTEIAKPRSGFVASAQAARRRPEAVHRRAGVVAEALVRDDRCCRETRALGAVIVPFLVAACGLLYLFPEDARHWLTWNEQPAVAPLITGAGYIAGGYFFVRVARETRWHRSQVGFLPMTAFAAHGHQDVQPPRPIRHRACLDLDPAGDRVSSATASESCLGSPVRLGDVLDRPAVHARDGGDRAAPC
jgi:hypothetical protein